MKAERLEELARKAQASADDKETAIEAYLSDADLADLARCARVVAKADRLKREYEHFKRIEGLGAFLGIGVRGWSDSKSFMQVVEDAHDPSPTAIEAVEAAEEAK